MPNQNAIMAQGAWPATGTTVRGPVGGHLGKETLHGFVLNTVKSQKHFCDFLLLVILVTPTKAISELKIVVMGHGSPASHFH